MVNKNLNVITISNSPLKNSFREKVTRDFIRNKYLYLMILPVLIFYFLFHYKPMYGALMAFQNYNPAKGILGSQWVGLQSFVDLFKDFYFFRILRNTLLISVYSLIFEFPAPIILALLLNELKGKYFKVLVQTVTYVPYFVSLVVICGIIKNFTLDTGVINDIIELLGFDRVTMLQEPQFFRTIYIGSSIWQGMGWGSIIYLSALMNIDMHQYEAAVVDGAGRWKQLLHITIPGIMPTVIVMFILKMGGLMNVGFEKVILLYNPVIYETADVISSYAYRKGLQEFSWSFSATVGLFNSVINLLLLILSNKISKKVNETSLW